MWKQFNNNPVGRSVGDCAVRAAIDGKDAYAVWEVMDELLSVLQATNPRLFDGVMRKIEQI